MLVKGTLDIGNAIILTAAVYWIVQIRGVMEMLELAYG